MFAPMQILAGGLTTKTGTGSIVTRCVSVAVHPLVAVPVTVYSVVDGGVAMGLVQEVQDRPVPGDHT